MGKVTQLTRAYQSLIRGCGHKWLVGTEQGEQGRKELQPDCLSVQSPPAPPAYLHQLVLTTLA